MKTHDSQPRHDEVPAPEGTGSVSERRKKYALLLAQGVKSPEAARQSGFSPSYAKKTGRLKKGQGMKEAIEEAEKVVKEVAGYDLTMAFAEINTFIEFAKLHKNAMAHFKAVELKARLSGLLIERREVVTVNLAGALADAYGRIRDLAPVNHPGLSDDSPPEKNEAGGGMGVGTPKKHRDS